MKPTAPGSAAGFMFQPERALWHLAVGGEIVGIETTDDVTRINADGSHLSEQAKHTLVGRNPFSDKSPGLWRTLEIWVNALNAGEVEPDGLRLQLVTNAIVGEGLARTLSNSRESKAVDTALEELLRVGATITGERQISAQAVCTADREILKQLIRSIRVVDGSEVASDNLRGEIAERLNIPDDVSREEVIQSLLGWVHETCMDLWRSGRSAWISRSAFKTRATRVISRFVTNILVERTVEALPVSNEERAKYANHMFVEQIRLLNFSEDFADDYVIEAVEDLIRCMSERTRLLENGRITGEHLTDFEERLYHRWRMQSRRHWRDHPEDDSEAKCECGQKLFQESIEHRETLAGVPTQQYFLTRGHLHRLSDKLRLGWHPDYLSLLNDYVHE